MGLLRQVYTHTISYSADALNGRSLCEHAYDKQDDRSHSLVGRQVPEVEAGERFESCEGIITLQQGLKSKTEILVRRVWKERSDL